MDGIKKLRTLKGGPNLGFKFRKFKKEVRLVRTIILTDLGANRTFCHIVTCCVRSSFRVNSIDSIMNLVRLRLNETRNTIILINFHQRITRNYRLEKENADEHSRLSLEKFSFGGGTEGGSETRRITWCSVASFNLQKYLLIRVTHWNLQKFAYISLEICTSSNLEWKTPVNFDFWSI